MKRVVMSLSNLLVPPLLFFILGFIAKSIRSDLDIPSNFIKIMSIYLMTSIGIQGGIELKHADLFSSIKAVSVAFALGIFQPIIAHFFLNKVGKIDKLNSAAIAAHYGSVSVSTFLTAVAFLHAQHVTYEPYPTIMLSILEFPSICIGLTLAHFARLSLNKRDENWCPKQFWNVIKAAITSGSIVLLLGGIIIGCISLPHTIKSLQPFYHDLFYGILSLFVLAMGMEASSRIQDCKKVGKFLMPFILTITNKKLRENSLTYFDNFSIE